MSSNQDNHITKKGLLSLAGKLTSLYLLTNFCMIIIAGFYLYHDYQLLFEQVHKGQMLQDKIIEAHMLAKLGFSTLPIQSDISLRCLTRMMVLLITLSIISVTAGYMIAKNTMNKISDLNQAMQGIDKRKLDQRIDTIDWPRELKPLAISFNEMLERLKNSFEQLSRFSSDIAHELRTPLNNLQTMIDVTLAKPRSSDNYQELMLQIKAMCQNLSGLTENLLFIARAERGQIKLNSNKINLNTLLRHVIDFYQASLDEKNIELKLTGDAYAEIDPTLFPRIAHNLLSNAIRHTPEGGMICIDIQSRQDTITIDFIDNGEGIPSDQLNKLFNRFHRVDSSRCLDTGGSGLGLSIAECITKLHHGIIEISSTLGHGTRATLHFPVFMT